MSSLAWTEQFAVPASGMTVLGHSPIGPQRTLDYGTRVLDAAVFGVGFAKVF